MHNDLVDSPQEQVVELLSHAVLGAIEKLQLAAEGQRVFDSDHQLRSCVALARMASLLFAQRGDFEPRESIISPLVPPDEAAELLRRFKERTRRYCEEPSQSNLAHHEAHEEHEEEVFS